MDKTSNSHRAESTEVVGCRMTYDWKIKDFKLLPQMPGESITSPSFYAGPNREMWSLELFPRGEKKRKNDHISLYLCLKSSDKLNITVDVEFLIFKSNKAIARDKFNYTFDGLKAYGNVRFARRSDLMNRSRTDKFIIRCKLDIITPSVDAPCDRDQTQLSKDLCLLLEDGKFSDISIIVGNERFRAHKSILSVRSPVFAAMFQHEDMVENVKNEVNIEYMEPAVARAMLEYFYTGQVDDLEVLATGLLAAANKYEVVGLQFMCEEILKEIVDTENAIEILTLADLYGIAHLKKKAMEFIGKNFSEVIKTDDYKQMKNYELLKDLMCYFKLPETRMFRE